jgi:hypothetical protein
MIIGIVALVLVVGGALAYFATRSNDNVPEATSTTIVQQQPANPTPGTVVVTPPATAPDTVVVERPVVVPQTRTIERNTRTDTTRVVPAPQGSSSGGNSTAPNVTVNTNVAPPASTSSGNNGGTAAGGASGGTGSGAGAPSDSGAGGTNDAGSASQLPPPAQ